MGGFFLRPYIQLSIIIMLLRVQGFTFSHHEDLKLLLLWQKGDKGALQRGAEQVFELMHLTVKQSCNLNLWVQRV